MCVCVCVCVCVCARACACACVRVCVCAGDNSPSYFNDVKYWSRLDGNQGCDEPRVTLAQHIRHVTPDVKLVLVVRHPTPRLVAIKLHKPNVSMSEFRSCVKVEVAVLGFPS